VHGAVTNGAATWSAQTPPTERWKVLVVDRRGYCPDPPAKTEDLAPDIADLLGDGAHLVCHSCVVVAAILAAARRPTAVRSRTVIEPPAFRVVGDHPAVREFQLALRAW
jgi:hypothetical protein